MTNIAASATSSDARDLGKKVIRFGWIAKGFVYAVLALLTFEVVFAPSGSSGSQASSRGVIQRIAAQPFGKVLLVVLAAGLVAYALGRLAEATFLADDDEGWLERAGYLRSALFYGFIAVLAIMQVVSSGGSSGGSQTSSWTSDLMRATGGRFLVGAAGVAIVGFGLWYAYRGISRRFMDDLNTGEMDEDTRTTARWLGISGMMGRGLSFGLIGAFVTLAAVQFDPDKAKGLDKALAEIADTSWGPFVIVVLGIGLAAYAAYCLFEARYRDLTA